jgi:hypothetical protein
MKWARVNGVTHRMICCSTTLTSEFELWSILGAQTIFEWSAKHDDEFYI